MMAPNGASGVHLCQGGVFRALFRALRRAITLSNEAGLCFRELRPMHEPMMLDQQVSRTPALDLIACPADLRTRAREDLHSVAGELRQECIETVAVTGGHLGSSLGVIELTVALHYVFETPHDRLIWDVGHQAYPHKILTGRRDQMRSLRQGGGLSGFTKRAESEYDPFGAAQSSTSISSALGFAVARDMQGEQRHVVAVIGDGAMSAGMAYEALNNAGALCSKLIASSCRLSKTRSRARPCASASWSIGGSTRTVNRGSSCSASRPATSWSAVGVPQGRSGR